MNRGKWMLPTGKRKRVFEFLKMVLLHTNDAQAKIQMYAHFSPNQLTHFLRTC